jgi:hypothetical protein
MGFWDIASTILSGGGDQAIRAAVGSENNDVVTSFASLGLSDLSGDLALTSLGKKGFAWTDKMMGTENSGLYGGGLNAQLGIAADVVIPAAFGYYFGIPAAAAALSDATAAAEAGMTATEAASAAEAAATTEAGVSGAVAASESGAIEGILGEELATTGAYTVDAAPWAEVDAYLGSTGNLNVSGNVTGLYVGEGAEKASIVDKLLSSARVANSIAKVGTAITPPKPNQSVYGGSSSTRVQQPLQDQEITNLMSEALGPSGTSAKFDRKGVTLNNNEKNILYKSFLSGDKQSPLTTSKVGDDLEFRTLKSESPSAKRNKSTGLRNISVASPFY